MDTVVPKVDFEWINSTMTNPTISQDLAVQRRIRKQAMKKVGLERRGTFGKHNLRQYPVCVKGVEEIPPEQRSSDLTCRNDLHFLNLPDVAYPCAGSGPTQNKRKNRFTGTRSRRVIQEPKIEICASMPASGFASTRIKYGIDIVEVSTLNSLNIGRGPLRYIMSDSFHLLFTQLQRIQWSFFSHLPSRYGENTCLTHAMDCILARIRQRMSPEIDKWKFEAMSSYMKALKSLQKAIDSPDQRLEAEVVCATQILCLYEMLDPNVNHIFKTDNIRHIGGVSRPKEMRKFLDPANCGELFSWMTAWRRHAEGASRLIQLRGSENYTTDFEKSIIGTHIGIEQWRAVMRSTELQLSPRIVRPVVSEDGQLFNELLFLNSCVFDIFMDTAAWDCSRKGGNSSNLRRFANQAYKVRANLLSWRRLHTIFLEGYFDSSRESAVQIRWALLYSLVLLGQTVVSRLLAAVSLSKEDFEKGIQNLLSSIFNTAPDLHSTSNNYLTLVNEIIYATEATLQEWEEMSDQKNEEGLNERWKFEIWCRRFGRKVEMGLEA